jgi:hypothetical protein
MDKKLENLTLNAIAIPERRNILYHWKSMDFSISVY